MHRGWDLLLTTDLMFQPHLPAQREEVDGPVSEQWKMGKPLCVTANLLESSRDHISHADVVSCTKTIPDEGDEAPVQGFSFCSRECRFCRGSLIVMLWTGARQCPAVAMQSTASVPCSHGRTVPRSSSS